MSGLLHSLVTVVLGLGLLVLLSVVGAAVPLHPFVPDVVLPLALLLGVRPEVPLVRGAVTAFALGFVLDTFSGNPLGLHTFVTEAVFLVARGAGLRLSLRGVGSQVGLTFVVALAAVGVAFALRVIFEPPPPFPVSAPWALVGEVLAPAAATAVVSPLVLALARRLDELGATRRRAA